MKSAKLLLLSVLAGAMISLMLATEAAADGGYGGPCAYGYWPDANGCCPEIIKGNPYYRDAKNQCYPKQINYRVYYADSYGCYPDESGTYNGAGKSCPHEQKCYPSCEKPHGYEQTTTKEYYPPKTTSEEKTTTHYYPPKTTSEEQTTTHYYPPKTTSEEQTTTKYYPPKTTSEEKTTTHYYPPKTTSEEKTTTHYYPPKTTSEEHKTTTKYYPPKTTSEEKNYGKCPYNKEKDGHGCCPREIDGMWFYRDGRGCYPIKTYGGVLYADGNGCYPDNKGVYLKAGDKCPYDRQCKPECDGGYSHY